LRLPQEAREEEYRRELAERETAIAAARLRYKIYMPDQLLVASVLAGDAEAAIALAKVANVQQKTTVRVPFTVKWKTHIYPLANRGGHDPYTPNQAWLGRVYFMWRFNSISFHRGVYNPV
jgi:hypothetical protein